MEQEKIQENEGSSLRQTQGELGSGQVTKRLGARDLFLKLLKNSGVTPDEEEDGRLSFWYGDEKHSEHIMADVQNGNILIKMYDYNWYSVSQWDIETVNELQKRINRSNVGNRAKIVYHFADDDQMWLTSIVTFPFSEEIEDLSGLLGAELQCLEDTHLIIPQREEPQKDIVSDEEKDKGEKGGKE